ncbi:aspartate aminotransferase family protein [Pelagibacterales bacterium]|nr:aspartate aminotransferase family protein [Pelagibacterales bacterium]
MSNILPTYPRSNLTFEYGKGSYLFEANGDQYLDFGSGIAVNSLGYANEYLNEKLMLQAQKLWHVSNVYQIPEQETLAKRLCDLCFADYVFFCNSGAESIEAAIKIARRYFYVTENSKTKNEIITFTGSFHGRTLGALAAGGLEKLDGFNTAVPGFKQVKYNDHDGLLAAINKNTAAILIEPIQGEGGVSVLPVECLNGLRKLCDENNILLIFDEVQCGFLRSGKMFAYQWSDIKPDIMTTAKAIANGFPLGATMTTKKVGEVMNHGTHGSTYGGNPLAVAVGNAVLDLMQKKDFLENLEKVSSYFFLGLQDISNKYPDSISEIRGKGLILGLKCVKDNITFVEELRQQKMLSIKAGDNVVRLLPPLTLSIKECDEALNKITKVCQAGN